MLFLFMSFISFRILKFASGFKLLLPLYFRYYALLPLLIGGELSIYSAPLSSLCSLIEILLVFC